MTTAAAHARHLTLLRLERAAGQAFGCLDEAGPARGPRRAAPGPALIARAAALTAILAMLVYLV